MARNSGGNPDGHLAAVQTVIRTWGGNQPIVSRPSILPPHPCLSAPATEGGAEDSAGRVGAGTFVTRPAAAVCLIVTIGHALPGPSNLVLLIVNIQLSWESAAGGGACPPLQWPLLSASLYVPSEGHAFEGAEQIMNAYQPRALDFFLAWEAQLWNRWAPGRTGLGSVLWRIYRCH